MICHIIVKPISFFLFLLLGFSLISQTLFAQDIIVLKSGEEVPVKIYSTKGKMITYSKLDDLANFPSELNKKHVRRYVMEYMKHRRISFSFSLGGLPYGTSTSLKKYMRDHGHEGTSSGFFGSIHYPVSNVKSSLLMELEYLYKPPHGVSIEYAYANIGKVEGFGTPEINYSNKQIAACHKFYLKNLRSNLQTGLIINFGSIEDDKYSYTNDAENKQSNVNWGLLFGCATPLVEKKELFLRLQTQFRYIFPVKITNKEMFLYGEKVALSHWFIGLQTGFKIYTNNN